jgi:hypothetical protein
MKKDQAQQAMAAIKGMYGADLTPQTTALFEALVAIEPEKLGQLYRSGNAAYQPYADTHGVPVAWVRQAVEVAHEEVTKLA